MLDELLKAERLLARGRYEAVITTLEPLVLSYRDSYIYYYLLGSAFLRTGDVGGALDCLRRAEQLNFKHAGTQIALAAIHVRKGETEKAVRIYLEVLDREPSNATASHALKFLRAKSDQESIAKAVADGSIALIYPRHRRDIRAFALFAAIAAFIGAVSVFAGPGLLGVARSLTQPNRPGLASVQLTDEDRKNPVSSSGGFVYVLSEREAIEVFEKAKRLFSEYRDEAALVECNRIARSNASPAVKNKAAALRSFVRPPSFENMKDFFTYQDVKKDPRLYEDVAVSWRGLAANVLTTENGVIFDFLAGYENKKRLDGIVAAKTAFKFDLSVDRSIEILARVKPLTESSFELEAVSIHELQEE
ncbi:MAG: hypothetical protein NT080_14430 [Spirochaetes bacterium]|nr:hypothetical protein [Spirochaetota bacterium]